MLVFAKAPIAGHAKTRLIPALGPEGAARLQAALTRRSLRTACAAFPSAASPGAVSLCCTPNACDPWFQGLAAEFPIALRDQSGANLGARMDDALTKALEEYKRAILIGTDCPVLTPDMLRAVDTTLEEGAEAAIVPAEDGGYVLVALKRPFPALFADIEWGTEQVLSATLRRIGSDGRPARIMEPIWDIDDPCDLERLKQQHPDIYESLSQSESA